MHATLKVSVLTGETVAVWGFSFSFLFRGSPLFFFRSSPGEPADSIRPTNGVFAKPGAAARLCPPSSAFFPVASRVSPENFSVSRASVLCLASLRVVEAIGQDEGAALANLPVGEHASPAGED